MLHKHPMHALHPNAVNEAIDDARSLRAAIQYENDKTAEYVRRAKPAGSFSDFHYWSTAQDFKVFAFTPPDSKGAVSQYPLDVVKRNIVHAYDKYFEATERLGGRVTCPSYEEFQALADKFFQAGEHYLKNPDQIDRVEKRLYEFITRPKRIGERPRVSVMKSLRLAAEMPKPRTLITPCEIADRIRKNIVAAFGVPAELVTNGHVPFTNLWSQSTGTYPHISKALEGTGISFQMFCEFYNDLEKRLTLGHDWKGSRLARFRRWKWTGDKANTGPQFVKAEINSIAFIRQFKINDEHYLARDHEPQIAHVDDPQLRELAEMLTRSYGVCFGSGLQHGPVLTWLASDKDHGATDQYEREYKNRYKDSNKGLYDVCVLKTNGEVTFDRIRNLTYGEANASEFEVWSDALSFQNLSLFRCSSKEVDRRLMSQWFALCDYVWDEHKVTYVQPTLAQRTAVVTRLHAEGEKHFPVYIGDDDSEIPTPTPDSGMDLICYFTKGNDGSLYHSEFQQWADCLSYRHSFLSLCETRLSDHLLFQALLQKWETVFRAAEKAGVEYRQPTEDQLRKVLGRLVREGREHFGEPLPCSEPFSTEFSQWAEKQTYAELVGKRGKLKLQTHAEMYQAVIYAWRNFEASIYKMGGKVGFASREQALELTNRLLKEGVKFHDTNEESKRVSFDVRSELLGERKCPILPNPKMVKALDAAFTAMTVHGRQFDSRTSHFSYWVSTIPWQALVGVHTNDPDFSYAVSDIEEFLISEFKHFCKMARSKHGLMFKSGWVQDVSDVAKDWYRNWAAMACTMDTQRVLSIKHLPAADQKSPTKLAYGVLREFVGTDHEMIELLDQIVVGGFVLPALSIVDILEAQKELHHNSQKFSQTVYEWLKAGDASKLNNVWGIKFPGGAELRFRSGGCCLLELGVSIVAARNVAATEMLPKQILSTKCYDGAPPENKETPLGLVPREFSGKALFLPADTADGDDPLRTWEDLRSHLKHDNRVVKLFTILQGYGVKIPDLRVTFLMAFDYQLTQDPKVFLDTFRTWAKDSACDAFDECSDKELFLMLNL